MAGGWATSAFRWVASDLVSLRSSSIMRWGLLFSEWPELGSLSFSIVDDVVWSVIMAFESVALVSMLGCFFLFCGCTL